MLSTNVYIAIIIALVVVIVWMLKCNISNTEDYINGVWVASPNFIDDSDLGNMTLTIQPDLCYLIAVDKAGREIANHTVEIKRTSWLPPISGCFSQTTNIGMLEIDDHREILPSKLKMQICPWTGEMILLDDNTVYGHFFRDGWGSSQLSVEY